MLKYVDNSLELTFLTEITNDNCPESDIRCSSLDKQWDYGSNMILAMKLISLE
jgi:hypothetical protein